MMAEVKVICLHLKSSVSEKLEQMSIIERTSRE